MENYKILGVDKNSSMEEIRQAYENKVNEIKIEVLDERRAKAFVKVLDKAYEEIKLEKEKIQNQETMIIKHKNTNLEYYTNDKIEKNINYKDQEFEEEKDDIWRNKLNKKCQRKQINKKVNKNKGKVSSNNNKNKKIDNRNKKYKKSSNTQEKNRDSSLVSTLIKLPFKILISVITVVLSFLIFLFKIINLISWVVSKILIIAAISASAIHGYQIYMGQAIQYNIFVLCAIIFIVSLFLPSITRFVVKTLSLVNDKLKNIVKS